MKIKLLLAALLTLVSFIGVSFNTFADGDCCKGKKHCKSGDKNCQKKDCKDCKDHKKCKDCKKGKTCKTCEKKEGEAAESDHGHHEKDADHEKNAEKKETH